MERRTRARFFGVVVIGHAAIGAPAATIVQVVISGLFLAGPIGFLVHARPQVARGTASLRVPAMDGRWSVDAGTVYTSVAPREP